MDTNTATTQTDVSYCLASISSRFLALLIDCLVLILPIAIIHLVLPFVGPGLIGFFYFPIFHASPLQATPGKRAMDIMVMDKQGQTLSLLMAFVRHLIALASGCLFFIGHFVAFFTEKRQAAHDLGAESIVVEGRHSEMALWNAWMETIRRLFGGARQTIHSITPKAGVKKRLDDLERLHEMRQKGILSEEEYQRLKGELI